MPANAESIEFSYDIKSFKEAMEKMTNSFDSFTEHLKKGSEKTQKKENNVNHVMKKNHKENLENMKKLSGQIIKKIALIGTALGGIFLIAKNFIGSIPEIGVTFKLAGDIIKRNLLYPLRLQLIPLLQKFLDWVKDNRSAFIQMGSVIVNVFKMVGTLIKTILSFAKSFFSGFTHDVNLSFSNLVNKITDFINIATFKITAMLMILKKLLQPIFEPLGQLIRQITDDIISMGEKLIEEFLTVLTKNDSLKNFVDIFKNLKTILTDLKPILDFTSKALGYISGLSFDIVAKTLKDVVQEIKNLIELITLKIDIKEFLKKINWKDVALTNIIPGGKITKNVAGSINNILPESIKTGIKNIYNSAEKNIKSITINAPITTNINNNQTEQQAKHIAWKFNNILMQEVTRLGF